MAEGRNCGSRETCRLDARFKSRIFHSRSEQVGVKGQFFRPEQTADDCSPDAKFTVNGKISVRIAGPGQGKEMAIATFHPSLIRRNRSLSFLDCLRSFEYFFIDGRYGARAIREGLLHSGRKLLRSQNSFLLPIRSSTHEQDIGAFLGFRWLPIRIVPCPVWHSPSLQA
jgi:hypothetical protein